jgi:hypothetical protein
LFLQLWLWGTVHLAGFRDLRRGSFDDFGDVAFGTLRSGCLLDAEL